MLLIAIIASLVLACVSSAVTRSIVYGEVITAEEKVDVIQTQLDDVNILLDNEIFSLNDTIFQLNNKTEFIMNLTTQLTQKSQEVINLVGEKSLLNITLFHTQQWLYENLTIIDALNMNYNVTEADVISFIENDTTDNLTYDALNFSCSDFSAMVNNHAMTLGINSSVIILRFEDTTSGHALVGFNTTDKGTIYFEPQTDERVVNLTIGKEYWTECIIGSHADHANDTIRRIIKIW